MVEGLGCYRTSPTQPINQSCTSNLNSRWNSKLRLCVTRKRRTSVCPNVVENSKCVTATSNLISFRRLCRSAIDHRRQSTNTGQCAIGTVVSLGAAGTLTPLDRATETLCQKNWIRYQRFMDDYMIFAKTHNKLKAAIKRVYAVLEPFSCKIQAN